MNRIVIVEDDACIARELTNVLTKAGYEAVSPALTKQPEKDILALSPDLVLLDVNLAGISGLSVCDGIRESSDVPVIFVTSNNTSMDELNCILRGGDDYVSKPYELPVLLARIGALLRRAGKSDNRRDCKITCRGVTLDVPSGEIFYKDKSEALTKNELKILYYLFTNQGRIVSRAELIDYLWDNEIFIDDNTLSVNVTRLRAKLTGIGAGHMIATRRGLGYQV